jgi:hypothetical protein
LGGGDQIEAAGGGVLQGFRFFSDLVGDSQQALLLALYMPTYPSRTQTGEAFREKNSQVG